MIETGKRRKGEKGQIDEEDRGETKEGEHTCT